jgi:hypothetical protein
MSSICFFCVRLARVLTFIAAIVPGVDPMHTRARSVSLVLPKDTLFNEAAAEALSTKSGAAHILV